MRNYLLCFFLSILSSVGFGQILEEGFDDITTLTGSGWTMTNQSSPMGTVSWMQGNSVDFAAHLGSPNAYIAVNYQSTSGTGVISNWLITPTVNVKDGDTLSFWTRTADFSIWDDRLEVRSSVGTMTVPSGGSSSVGSFTNVHLIINDDYSLSYPEVWTEYIITVSGVGSTPVAMNFAFRYNVIDAGPNGTYSNYIGIDTVTIEEGAGGGADYCIPTYSTGCSGGDDIDDFIMADAGINHLDSGCSTGGYGDFTGDASLNGNMEAGENYTFSATHNFSGQYLKVWIDLNGNGSFGDPGELLFTSSSGSGNTSGSITIPEGTESITTRMRVMGRWNSAPTDSCNPGGSWGETHDYKVIITGEEEVEYCIPTYSTGCSGGDDIDDFIMAGAGINHLDSGCSTGGYGDFTGNASLNGNMDAGENYTFSATHNFSGQYLKVWIDLNGNGSFEDPGELLFTSTSGSGNTSGSITIPEGTENITTRMRVMGRWNSAPTNSCTPGGSWGETHDYKVTINGDGGGEPGGDCDLNGDTTDGEIWDRPLEGGGGMSTVGVDVRYEVIGPFTVDAGGTYTITSTQDGWDGFLLVYQNEFDPENALVNHVASDDDFGGTGVSQVTPNLTTGTDYFIVTTGFQSSDYGTYSTTVTGPGNMSCDGENPPPGGDCEILYDGSLEDGLGALDGGVSLAADFNVAADVSMSVETITMNLYSNVSTVNVGFQADNAGTPGAVISAPVSIVPTSQTFIGTSPVGTNIYEVVLDLPTPQVFEGGATGTNYWMNISTTFGTEGSNYWEFSDTVNNGTNFFYSLDAGASWTDAGTAGFIEDGAFVLAGTCGGEVDPPAEDCEILYDGSLEDGLGALDGGVSLAADFNVAADVSMSVETITMNLYSNVSTVNVGFQADNAGTPGAVISAPVSIVPTSQTFIGTSPVGTNIYEVVLDLPTPQVFEGGATGTNYWMNISTTFGTEGSNYWEFSDTVNNGTNFFYSLDAGASWTDAGTAGFIEDGAFVLAGSCGGEEPPAEDCEILYDGSLEDGLGALDGGVSLAADFNVAADVSMSVETITMNLYSNVSTVNVGFQADNAGTPGAVISAPVSIVPTSQTFIGTSPVGTNIYEVVLDLPTPQVFEGGATGTNYWMNISTTFGTEGSNYWEFSDTVNNGTNFFYSLDAGASWTDAGTAGFIEDGAFVLAGTCGGEVDPPSDNDECDGAIAIACGETMTGTTADATDSGANASADRFYSFTSSGTPEEVTISLCGSAYDTYLRVFTDCTLSNEVAFNDDFCGVQSELSFVPDVNTTYYIMVEGWSTNTGTYTISVSCDEPFIVEEPDYPCFQGDGMNSNNFENGYNVTAGGTFRNADDFTVDNTFSLQYVRLNLFMIPGTTANSATFNIRADEGGAPSESNIVSTINATPTSQVVIGNNFGYDISQVEFILDTPVDFSAGTYWLQPEVNSDGGVVFWEVTTTGSNGGLVHTSESGGAWNQDPDGFQGVFFVAGVCDDTPPPVDCSQETPSNSFENGHGNLHMLKVANDFNVEINESFTVEQFKFNVILPAGATVDALDYYFYEDTGSGPGNEVDNTLFASPTSVEFVGNLSSFEVYTVTVDLDTPVVLNGSTSGDTAYWLGIMIYTGAANSYWEGTSVINTANEGYLELDGVWAPISTTFGSDPFDGVMEISGTCATLGVSDMTSFDFAYYPNPVKDILNITSDKNIENVSVFNLAGQQVMTSAKVNNGQINVTALPAGVYVFKATLQGGQVETFKIIKK